ncbi:MAG TPA: hypothetical protein PLI09_22530 [Candidatus Hydrogenedentes bacterium]|nr:hypothetical protein [Candidatus Hydrogenedentota bacterium]
MNPGFPPYGGGAAGSMIFRLFRAFCGEKSGKTNHEMAVRLSKKSKEKRNFLSAIRKALSSCFA